MNKRFWVIIVFLVLGFTGFMMLHNDTKTTADTQTTAKPVSHITGDTSSTVQLVEYSDFQCPACRAYYPIVKQVIDKYKDKIGFTYKQYPLTTIHRNAFAAARASEAAEKQGKFWPMYDLLFQQQQTWAESNRAQTTFLALAQQIGLDIPAYKKDFASSATNNAILASIKEFNALGLSQSTPTFILNGKKITPDGTLADFSRYIDKELAK